MMFKSKVFILTGIFSLIGLFIAHKLIISYNLGGEGVNLLPINLFEFLLLALSILIVLIILFIGFLMLKRQKVKISSKKKVFFSISLIIGFTIIFFLLNDNNSQIIAPISLIYFGVFLLIWNVVNNSKLSKLGIIEVILGLSAFILSNNNLLFMAIGFGVIPIIYGFYLFKKT